MDKINYESMSKEQKELLYDIANWHDRLFYNEMKDYQNSSDLAYSRACEKKIKELENRYIEFYGELPEWKLINDVWKTQSDLKKILESDGN